MAQPEKATEYSLIKEYYICIPTVLMDSGDLDPEVQCGHKHFTFAAALACRYASSCGKGRHGYKDWSLVQRKVWQHTESIPIKNKGQ